jgi:hypothetical protein
MLVNLLFLLLTAAAPPLRSQPLPPQELRAAVENLKDAVSSLDTTELERMLSDDADLWTGGSRPETGRAAVARRLTQRPVWSERSAPIWRDESIRVLTPDVALVDARMVQHGTVFLSDRSHVLFVFRKEPAGWRISSIRLNGPAWETPRIVPAL